MTADLVFAFCRFRGRILLIAGDDSPVPGQWRPPWGIVDDDPTDAAIETIRALARDPVGFEVVARGSPVSIPAEEIGDSSSVVTGDGASDREVHPVMVDCESDPLESAGEDVEGEWVHPPAILRRETVPGCWRAYEGVAPTVRAVAADAEHGSAYVSVRGLEVLRDRAGLLAARYDDDPDDWGELADLARQLRNARPSMAALANRVDRVMAEADRRPGAVERRASDAVDAAVTADEEAAGAIADRLEGSTVLTLSKSGTVLDALRAGAPERVFVAESRPACEGVGVAEALAEETSVVLHTDAAVAHLLATEPIDAVVVGADAIRPDGGVVNKTGTRAAAVAAAHESVPVFAVTAVDKVATGGVALESAPGSAVYDGDRPIEARNPTFDETPPDLVTGIATERGILDTDDVAGIATELRTLAAWDEEHADER